MSSKKLNLVVYTICCILALYGLIILIRKIMLDSNSERKSKKELGIKFYIEPFRQNYLPGRLNTTYSSPEECIESEKKRYKKMGSLSSDTLSHIYGMCAQIKKEPIISSKSRKQKLNECIEEGQKSCKKTEPGCLQAVERTCNMLYK
jgi:hypothetical protein